MNYDKLFRIRESGGAYIERPFDSQIKGDGERAVREACDDARKLWPDVRLWDCTFEFDDYS